LKSLANNGATYVAMTLNQQAGEVSASYALPGELQNYTAGDFISINKLKVK
jgi:hypothetical protein